MIKLRNQGELEVRLQISGTLNATAGNPSNSATAIVPFAARLKAVFARMRTANGTSASVDILKNNASLVSSGALISFTTAVTPSAYNTANLTANPPTFVKGDTVSVVVSAVTGAGNDLEVILMLERQRSHSWNDPVQTDTVGADSDAIG